MMNTLAINDLRSVLCLGAHPDDIEIGCGSTLEMLLEASPNLHVDWVVFSGTPERRREAEQSAAIWLQRAGSCQVRVHDFPDGFFPACYEELKKTVQGLAQITKPGLIFTHRLEDRHQDHRLLAELTWNAFRNHLVWEYEIPKYEGDLEASNMFVPVDAEGCQRKIERLKDCFASQSSKPWFDDELFRGLMRLRGIECGGAARYAEAFFVRKALFGFPTPG